MPVITRQIGPCFAADVEAVDMTKPLSQEDVVAIHAGMDEHAVLVFHDQRIDDEQQLAFTRSLGEIERAIGTSLRAPDEYRLPTTFADVSNLDKDNKVFAPRRSTRCCTPAASRRRAATPSSPTCVRRTTPLATRPEPRSRT